MLPWSDWVVPSALGTKVKPHHFTSRSTTRTMLSKKSGTLGDESKAVRRLSDPDGFAVCAAMVR